METHKRINTKVTTYAIMVLLEWPDVSDMFDALLDYEDDLCEAAIEVFNKTGASEGHLYLVEINDPEQSEMKFIVVQEAPTIEEAYDWVNTQLNGDGRNADDPDSEYIMGSERIKYEIINHGTTTTLI